MAEFKRAFNEANQLKSKELFEKLLSDIKDGVVLPALRNNYINFYYKGGGLFKYEKGKFSTHIKYAFTPNKKPNNSYVTEDKIKTLEISTSFVNSYNDIKKNCEIHGTVEATAVSSLYKNNGIKQKDGVILLDTEIAFYNDKTKDRIDLLLYNLSSKTLVFCEAKHFSNKELWASVGKKPDVIEQIKRYNNTILEIGAEKIIDEYGKYIKIMNDLFDTQIPLPEKLIQNVGLVITGYDSNQKTKIEKLLENDGSLEGINYYCAGNLNSIEIQSIYNEMLKGN